MRLGTIGFGSGSALCVLLVGACAVGPDYQRPDLDARTAAAWRQPVGPPFDPERTELARWWEHFGSPELSVLASRLLVQNLSLAEARQRVLTARAQRGVADGERWPQVSAGASYTRAGTGDRSLNFQGPPPGQDVDVYSASVSAGWELDLWGRVGRLLEAADAEIEVTVEDYRDAAVSLLSELALAYVDARTLHERVDVLARSVALRQETVRLAQSRVDAGSGTRLELEQARRELESGAGLLPELRRALAVAENRVAVLTGERPRDELLAARDELVLPATVGLGLPADLLARRADVRRSERVLAAAVARIGAAEAERYPDITISGTLALRAQDVDALTSGADALSYSVGPGLSIPLFTGGRIDSQVASRESAADGARLGFERTLLLAIAEVEDAAAGVTHTRERVDRLQAAADAARAAVTFAQQLHDAGSLGLAPVIDAQRAQLAADDALLLGRQAAFVQTIDLYRALGGGWEAIALDGSLTAPDQAEEPQP